MNKLLLLFFIYSANFISHNRDENKCLNIINNHNKIKRNILSRDLSVFYVKKEKNIGLNSIIKTDKLKKDGNSLLDYSTSFDHKTEIYNNVKKKIGYFNIFSDIILFLNVIFLMFNTYYFFKTFKKQRSYERNINNIIIANNEYNISDLNKTNILEKTVTELLLKLSEFEKSELFLNKNLSLSRLASYCNSNSRYVSVILNTHKNQDFYEYLSRLRIKYIIEKLNHNPKYRKFKIAALSEEAGFSSHNKFCSVFKRYIGITPSEYIKNIDNIISTIEDKI